MLVEQTNPSYRRSNVRNNDLGDDRDDAQRFHCLWPIHGGDNGYEYIEDDDEYEYYHDFYSYYRFVKRFPALLRLMDRGEWIGKILGIPFLTLEQ